MIGQILIPALMPKYGVKTVEALMPRAVVPTLMPIPK
jgi:hypothetical protein